MFACLFIPNFLLGLSIRRVQVSQPKMAILIDARTSLVVDAAPPLLKNGVRAGMSEREALALVPQAQMVTLDPDAIKDATERIIGILSDFSPTLEVLGPETFLCDLGVCSMDRLLRETQAMIDAVKSKQSFFSSVGVGSNGLVARAAAHASRPGKTTIISVGEEASFLSTLSLDVLPVHPETLRRLFLLGIKTVGQLNVLSPKELIKQFGDEGKKLAEWAQGRDDRRMQEIPYEESVQVTQHFDDPIEGGAPLSAAVEHLLDGLCDLLKKKRQLATSLELTMSFDCHAPHAILKVQYASPGSDVKRLLPSLSSHLATVKLSDRVESMTLVAQGLVPQHARQPKFFAFMEPGQMDARVQRLVSSLQSRGRHEAVMKVVWDDRRSRVPERIAHLQTMAGEVQTKTLCLPFPLQVVADEKGMPRHVHTKSGWTGVDSIIEVWELDEEWWKSRPIHRKYYRVLLVDGNILRIFCDVFTGCWYRQTR